MVYAQSHEQGKQLSSGKPLSNQEINEPIREIAKTTEQILPSRPETSRPIITGTVHSIRSTKTISENSYRQYLETHSSPLASYYKQLYQSSYGSVVIGISAIEEQYCKLKPPSAPFNCFGLMSKGQLIKFNDYGEAINYLNDFLAKHEDKHPTIESLNCYYVQPCSENWLKTVIKVKNELESLN